MVLGRCRRLWRSLNYEAGYLYEMNSGHKAQGVIDDWIDFYNTRRPHSALNGNTHDIAYGLTERRKLAA